MSVDLRHLTSGDWNVSLARSSSGSGVRVENYRGAAVPKRDVAVANVLPSLLLLLFSRLFSFFALEMDEEEDEGERRDTPRGTRHMPAVATPN